MSKHAGFAIKRISGTTGKYSHDYNYLLDGNDISYGLLKVQVAILPCERPTVTLTIEPDRVDIDGDFLVNVVPSEPQ